MDNENWRRVIKVDDDVAAANSYADTVPERARRRVVSHVACISLHICGDALLNSATLCEKISH
jgi:hypothetical protein